MAVVHSSHRAATSVGYMSAPVVVATNPEFRFNGSEPHTKVTIAQFEKGYLDMKALEGRLNELEGVAEKAAALENVLAELREEEWDDLAAYEIEAEWDRRVAEALSAPAGTWGGSATILGSPQGRSTRLSEEAILDSVRRSVIVE